MSAPSGKLLTLAQATRLFDLSWSLEDWAAEGSIVAIEFDADGALDGAGVAIFEEGAGGASSSPILSTMCTLAGTSRSNFRMAA
jgi:hypothetical protein